jgi:hypothetical protein
MQMVGQNIPQLPGLDTAGIGIIFLMKEEQDQRDRPVLISKFCFNQVKQGG